MVDVNVRLRENPVLQKMPKDEREWVQYTNELAKWVLQVAKLGSTIYQSDGSTIIDGLDEMPGQLDTERNLKMGLVGNNPSTTDQNPLSATTDGLSSTITIAAHILKTPTGDISYNSGSITGLDNQITYVVYADDPGYAGGTVTYVASTDNTSVVAIGRYYLGTITMPSGQTVFPTVLTLDGKVPGTKIADSGGDIIVELPADEPESTVGSGGGAWGGEFSDLRAER